MNKCSFFGCVDHIALETINDTQVVYLKIQIENKRQSKIKSKIDYEFLDFEAWGTAAITIANYVNIGDDILIVDATARQNYDSVCFRINEFRLI